MTTENTVTRAFVAHVLGQGHTISVTYDDDTTLARTKDAKAIFDELVAGDMPTAHVRNDAREYLGAFLFVYGNADDGSELIADHSDNAYCDAVFKAVMPEGE